MRFFNFECDSHGRNFLSFERLVGAPLEAIMRRENNLNHGVIRRIVYDVADALVQVHLSGLVHRDLTPRNVFVTIDGAVKVIDFGLTCDSGAEQTLPGFRGTQAYASPEALNESPVSPSADFYSLGAICYAMLTGRPPFGYGHLAEIKARMRQWDIKPLPDSTPADLREITMGLLRCEPSERAYKTAADLMLAFDLESGSVVENIPLGALAAQALGRMPNFGASLHEMIESRAVVLRNSSARSPVGLEPIAADRHGGAYGIIDILPEQANGKDHMVERVPDHMADNKPNVANDELSGAQRPVAGEPEAREESIRVELDAKEAGEDSQQFRGERARPNRNRRWRFVALAAFVLLGFGVLWDWQRGEMQPSQSVVTPAGEDAPMPAPEQAADLLPELSRNVVLNKSRSSEPEPTTTPAQEGRDTNRTKPKNEPVRLNNHGDRGVAQYPDTQSSVREPDRAQRLRIKSLTKDLRAGEQ